MAEFSLAGEYGAPESNFGFGDLAGTNNLGSGAGGYNLGGGSTYGLGDSLLGDSAFGETGLGDFGNFDSFNSYGLDGPAAGLWGNTTNPNPSGLQQSVTTMNDFLNKNRFGKLASTVIGFTPMGAAFNAARGAIGAHARGNTMGAIGAGMGAIGGPIGAIGSLATSNNPGVGFAGAGGSMLGNMIGGPIGGMVGGQLGTAAGRSGGGTGYSGGLNAQGSNGGYGIEGIAGDLAKMYAMSKASGGYGAAKDANSAIQGQISSLSNMYGPNSPYAQQLRQTLERKDAAAGRRSQYGPREVQLQAALADKAAQTAGTIGNLAQQSQTQSLALKNQKDQQRAQQLAMLFKMGQGSGAFGAVGNGLRDMFNDATGQTPYADNYGYGDTGGVSLGGNNFGNPAESYSSNNDWMNLGY